MTGEAFEALVLTLRPHGEHGAVVRFLGEASGLVVAYVHGARGRRLRALLMPGNRVALTLRQRAPDRLPDAALELVQMRAGLAVAPAGAVAAAYATALAGATLAEGVPVPRLFAALDGLLAALDSGLAGPAVPAAVVRFELLLLAEEGLGLDLATCALGGPADDLAFVSPRSGRAVSRARAAGRPWSGRLLPLPAFLLDRTPADAAAAADALALAAHFLWRHWPALRPALAPLRARIAGTGGERLAGARAGDRDEA